MYLLACWNVRSEVQTRVSFFYLLSLVIGGLGALLSFALSHMAGIGGLGGWSWIFIIGQHPKASQ